MANIATTVDFAPGQLDQAIEGYLCGLAVGAPNRDRLIDSHPDLADELRDFLRHDDWIRQLAGCKRANDSEARRSLSASPNGGLWDTTAETFASSTFGDYELLAEIGRGGMGVVYKARQKSLNRIVALKMIRSDQLASELEVERFYGESAAAAHLDHPGIVPVYAAGQQGGRHFYSMGFVEGISLQELIADEAMISPADAADLIHRVAEAIDYAHRRGVIHRDLKPANILLAQSDRQDAMQLASPRNLRHVRFEPKVTDFGLAKKTDDANDLTATGQILGTPSYMPPEQAAGTSGPLSDVYALGAVLYCLLTGRPPFRAANALQTLQQVAHDEPVPPRRLNSAVPRDLETICLKCLQKSPARRYGSAQELAADLKRFQVGEPIVARPIGRWERAYKWTRRYPAMAALSVVGPLMLMALAGLVVFQINQHKIKRLLSSRNVLGAHDAWRDNEIDRAQRLLEGCPPHLRGWEWGYVDRLCRTGHVKTLRTPTPRPGEPGAAGNKGPPLFVWDVTSGNVIAQFAEDDSQVIGVRFSPDNQRLEAASMTQSRLGERWEGFAPGGTDFKADNADRTITLLNLESSSVMSVTKGHAALFPRIAYSNDGSRIAVQLSPVFNANRFPSSELLADDLAAALNSDGVIRLADPKLLAEAIFREHSSDVLAVALSSDRERLATAGSDGKLKLWDVTHGQLILGCEGHGGPVYDVAFSPDGDRLASAGNDRTVRIWDALTGKQIRKFDGPNGHTRAVNGVAWHPSGGQVVSGGADLAVKIWNVASGSESVNLEGHTVPVLSVTYHPDDELLASGGSDGVIRFWNTRTRELLRELQAHRGSISALTFSAGGEFLASASHDRTVKVWKVSASQDLPVHTLKDHQGIVYSVAFSPDGRRLASAGHDGKCILWDLLTGRRQATIDRSPAGPVISIAFAPRGGLLAMGGYDLAVRSLANNSETLLTGPEKELLSVAFSPDGKRLASGGRDGKVRVWNAHSGALLATLEGHSAPVSSLVFSPTGDRVASASWDGSVRIWDPDAQQDQQEMLSLKGPKGRVYCVAFSPDGRHLASANHDGTITLWGR